MGSPRWRRRWSATASPDAAADRALVEDRAKIPRVFGSVSLRVKTLGVAPFESRMAVGKRVKHDPLYRVAHWGVARLARGLLRVRVIGADQVPDDGPVIVAANHASYFDIPLLGISLARQADYLAKRELFALPLVGALLRALGGVPVKRGGIDRAAMAEVARRLAAGRLLVIYPEGTRSRTGILGPARPGIGWIVAQSRAVVVPVFIRGTRPLRPFGEVTLRFGEPLDFGPDLALPEQMQSKKLYARIALRVMSEIEKLGQQRLPG